MRRWRLWPILVALLVVNYWVASTFPDKEPRAHIAYSPQFLREVQRDNVSLVTITDQSIEGEFKKAVTIDKKTFTRFATNQPALPTDNTLLALLKRRKVEINAKPADSGRGLLGQILLGFGPTLLILAIIIFFMRRAAAGGGALSALGRSRAKRYEGRERVTFEDVAGHRGGRAGARRGRGLPQEPREVRQRSGARSRAASCSRARPAPARRCSRAPSRARPACRSSRPARASSSR